MGFDIPDHDIHALAFALVGGFEHGIGFAYPGGITQGKSSSGRVCPAALQPGLGRAVHQDRGGMVQRTYLYYTILFRPMLD